MTDNPPMHGLHLSAEFQGCYPQADLMRNAATLQALCESAVAAAGLRAVDAVFHGFAAVKHSGNESERPAAEPGGITGVILLAESHLAIHTWPEYGSVTVDVYVCNVHEDRSAAARAVLAQLQAAFAPRRSTERETLRDPVQSIN